MRELPKAIKSGIVKLGFTEIQCAVLKDGRRLFTLSGMNRALGRAKPGGGEGAASEKLPPFLRLNILKPFITSEITVTSSSIEFRLPNCTKAIGYEAKLLPMVCSLYIEAYEKGVLDDRQAKFALTAKMVQKALSIVGVTALIDESCGYQELRDKNALQLLLDKYLSKEAARWAKTFPDQFYLEIFRLKKWNPSREIRHRPGVIAKYTNDLVYKRLAPNLLEALEEKNPILESGHRKTLHHQWLSKEQGLQHLKGHIFALQKLMEASKDWEDFIKLTNEILPYASTDDIEISNKTNEKQC